MVPGVALCWRPMIFNVYDGPRLTHVFDGSRTTGRLLGIVNEHAWGDAIKAALLEWPDRFRLYVIEIDKDPARRRDLIRPEFLLPLVTSDTLH